jgi:hypothetical protein
VTYTLGSHVSVAQEHSIGTDALSPLELPEWVEFTTWRTGLTAERKTIIGRKGTEARAVFYLDRRGRIKLPSLNPYLPVVFLSGRDRPSGRTTEWLELAGAIVEEMKRRGTANRINLPPSVQDVRPWSWRGFLVGVGYTYCVAFPFQDEGVERSHRRNIDKAAKLGLSVTRVRDVGPVLACLAETEVRKHFSHRIGQRELRQASAVLGEDHLRMYACFDAHAEPVSAAVVIHARGGWAIAWLAGAKTGRLAEGGNHLLWRYVLADLEEADAVGIDFCGADIQSIATFKSRWGASLAPAFNVRTYSPRTAARFVAGWLGC